MGRGPAWQRRLAMLAGVFLMVYGLFGAFALRGPLYATALCSATLLYVTVRLALGWWQA